LLALSTVLASCVTSEPGLESGTGERWLAGDHHIHSQFSVGWYRDTDPPSPILGGDAIYSIPTNARMAQRFGLSWMVITDHGGPNHSKINLEQAYPEMLTSRAATPEVIQFYGIELNSPGADHSSLIVPRTDDEAAVLYDLESRFDKKEAFPPDPERDTEAKMIEALEIMDALQPRPVVIANHPSRSIRVPGQYGRYEPAELRRWNDAAPRVAVGMAGAPGHQAATLNPDGSLDPRGFRGGYKRARTLGGFDPMTAKLGGFWDSMLAEGRRWWITANSDSHVHYTENGYDFWPGEYSKTYVRAEKSHAAILEGIRNGRIFVTTGDLVTEVEVRASTPSSSAEIGGELRMAPGDEVTLTIAINDPRAPNAHGDSPSVRRVDLIVGEVVGQHADPARDTNQTARVVRRFTRRDWKRDGERRVMSHRIQDVTSDLYLRIRGTNTDELEPELDPPGEDPWQDLWFYSNPIFIRLAPESVR
jgi:hypothetical protein